jgi:hypothetical protein
MRRRGFIRRPRATGYALPVHVFVNGGKKDMTAHCLMEWVKASGIPLLAVVVSGVSVLAVCVFSWWQVRIAREKLRYDLYDRRFSVYMAFHELLVAVVEKDNVDAELRKAIAAWAHSPFLLDAKLVDYLVGLHKEAFRIAEQPKLIRDLGSTTVESVQLAAKLGSDKLAFGGRLTELVREFESFLKLKDFSKR